MIRRSVKTAVAGLLLAAVVGCGNTLKDAPPNTSNKELPKPAQVVRETPQRSVLTVAWYGGERRRVEVVTGTGWWYQSGRPLIPVRWVFVRDRTGTHRDEYFFTTEVTMSVRAVIETYTGRWNLEMSHPDYPSSDNFYHSAETSGREAVL